ncbi:MAG: DNA metabolism protein [Clostridiales bacterium]|nr:DNA metabolism protein [Clostridiales bacterium]
MPDGSNLIYQYDGTFAGLLCCVFESYLKKEIPADIFPPDMQQATLFPTREIATDPQRAERVLSSIPKKMGRDALDFVRRAFLPCAPQKERNILLFLRLGYRYGPRVLDMLTNDTVDALQKAVLHLNNEAHLLKGFIRFSDFNGALAAEIEPKNMVLPLLVRHFCERYPEERFLIYDRTHASALIYRPYKPVILPVEDFQMPEPDEEERAFRELWRLFYKTIEIEGRHNPRCRMSHMPKRYWKEMTEFSRDSKKPPLFSERKN